MVLVGNSGVGKSSLLQRYAKNSFDAGYVSTIGVDFEVKTVRMHDKVAKMQLWDTAGQERFHNITTAYYRGSDCIVIVYDVSSRESFLAVPRWVEDVRRYGPKTVQMLLVGNKCDLTQSHHQRAVTFDEGRQMAETYNCEFLETSAKENTNVHLVFDEIVETSINKRIALQMKKTASSGIYDGSTIYLDSDYSRNCKSNGLLSCCRVM